MDPLRIAIRAVFAYVFLLTLVRISGKRVVKHGTPRDFVLALIFGDMVDDLLWAEVNASVFITAVGSLFIVSTMSMVTTWRARIGDR